MWRFADTSDYLVFFDASDNDTSVVPGGFVGWLQGGGQHGADVVLYKQVNTVSTPKTTKYLYFYSDRGISEHQGGSDVWLNVWNSPLDSSNSYISVESPSLQGSACLAGYCRSPSIWLMVR